METLPGTVKGHFTDAIQSTAHIVAFPAFLLGFTLFGFLLYIGRSVLVPLVVAFFLSYLVRPLADLITIPFDKLAQTACCSRCCSGYQKLLAKRQRQLEKARRRKAASFADGGGGSGAGSGVGGSAPSAEEDDDVSLLSDGEDAELQPCLGTDLRHRRAGWKSLGEEHDPSDHAPSSRDHSPGYGHAIPQYVVEHAMWQRWVAVFLAALFVVGVVVLLFLLVVDAIDTFRTKHFDAFQKRAVEITKDFAAWARSVFHINGEGLTRYVESAESEIPLQLLKGVALTAWGFVLDVGMIILFLVYILMGASSPSPVHSIRRQMDDRIESYIVAKSILSAIVGFLVFLVLLILDVKLAHLFGVLSFVLNYIPTVGALIATCLTIPIIVLDPESNGTNMMLAIFFQVLIHTIMGSFVEPIYFTRLVTLHPIIVLLAVSFWYLLWGIPGAMLSVPITAVARQWLKRGTLEHPYAYALRRVLEGDLEWMFDGPLTPNKDGGSRQTGVEMPRGSSSNSPKPTGNSSDSESKLV